MTEYQEMLRRVLGEELAPVREEPVKELDAASIAGGGVAEFTAQSRAEHSALVVAVRASYDPAATAGVRVRWLYSPDSVAFDSPEDAEDAGNFEDLTFSAGVTRQRTILVPLFKPYVRVQVVNLDPTYAVTVTAWKTMVR